MRIPVEEYSDITVNIDAVTNDLAATSNVGAWLAERLLDVPPFVQLGTTLTFGDSVLVPFVPGPNLAVIPIAPSRVSTNELSAQEQWNDLLTQLT